MDLKTGKGLVDRHEFETVDIDVFGLRGDPIDRIGDIVGRDRIDALIKIVRRILIAARAHQREFGFAHAGFDGRDAHPLPCRSERRPSENCRRKAFVPA